MTISIKFVGRRTFKRRKAILNQTKIWLPLLAVVLTCLIPGVTGSVAEAKRVDQVKKVKKTKRSKQKRKRSSQTVRVSTPASSWGPGITESSFAAASNIVPDWKVVQPSLVTIDAPMDSKVGPRSSACDKLQFMRYKHVDGPAVAQNADAVTVLMPGIFEGAGAMDSVASNIVTRAHQRNKQFVEVWLLDRRSNCVEDHTGIKHLQKTGSIKEAFDYYLEDRPIDGKKFEGWNLTKNEQDVVGSIGIKQTMDDYYEVIRRGIPDPAVRPRKVICGGHSLGGPLTGVFSAWDFDGNPQTTSDAGYKQCGGYVALDTLIMNSVVPFDITTRFGWALPDSLTFPEKYFELPIINPQVMTILQGMGTLAALKPKEELDVWKHIDIEKALDRFPLVRLSLAIMFSDQLGTFLQGGIRPDRFRLTNEAALGMFLDDNSFNFTSVAQVSTGFFKGGSIVDKNFPLPNQLSDVPLLNLMTENGLGGGNLAFPSEFKREGMQNPALYEWSNYNEVTPNKWTEPGQENTDIRQLARSVGVVPLDFTEKYFPVKIVTDLAPIIAGERKGGFNNVLENHMLYGNKHLGQPTLNLFAEKGAVRLGAPLVKHAGSSVVLPGYQHVDPLTAAPIQNDGRREQGTEAIIDFLASTIRGLV